MMNANETIINIVLKPLKPPENPINSSKFHEQPPFSYGFPMVFLLETTIGNRHWIHPYPERLQGVSGASDPSQSSKTKLRRSPATALTLEDDEVCFRFYINIKKMSIDR